ncbi:MAG TPA: amidase family protein [Thermoleophilaceae bacterium]
MNVAEYASCDATELSRLIASGEVSAGDVRDAALRAIEQVDPRLNAVVHGPFEDAAAGGGPFAGVPFAVKDTLMEAGRPCEFGSALLEGHVAAVDSTLAERFRAAGLAGLVRTATPEFAFSMDTSPRVNGSTLNPWSPDRSAGGSSGGSAALVAARAVPIGHANDGGGSIRIPAAWCGLVGLKPSRGRVPVGPLIGEVPGGIGHEFAVTRTVRDAAGLLDAVSGPAPGDRYYVAGPRRPFAEEVGADPGRLRVAVHTESFWGRETEPEVRAAVEAAAARLEELGHAVEPAAGAVHADALRRAHVVLWTSLLAGLADFFGALLRREASPETVEAASLACIRHGRELSAGDVGTAATIQNAVSRAWGAFLDEYDLFLCPTTPTAPPPAGTPAQDDPRHTTAESWIDEVFSYIPYPPIANTTGQPSISLPLGNGSDGLPIGVMLTAQTLREDVLLRVASQLEEAMPWAGRRPAVAAG